MVRSALVALALAAAVGTATAPVAHAASGITGLALPDRDAYRSILSRLDSADWTGAKQAILALDSADPMRPQLLSELYLAKDSPRVELFDILDLLNTAPWLERADQLSRLAQKRGATLLPDGPAVRQLMWTGGAPQRAILKPLKGDAIAETLAPQISQFIRDDQPSNAEALIAGSGAGLSREALTELRQRVAWSYYLTGDSSNARRLADQAVIDGAGPYVAPAQWVAGLADWRDRKWASAARAFAAVGRGAEDADLRSAGYFWAARAHMAAGEPQKVTALLQAAAREGDCFYGLLARETLGETLPSRVEPAHAEKRVLEQLSRAPNVRIAATLAALGRASDADGALRRQAELSGDSDYPALIDLAEQLSLPATQLWLAQRSPSGKRADAMALFPKPRWQPRDGWRVDSALVFAHTLQESRFRPDVVSPAGARGLMQLMPGTARDLAAERGEVFSDSQLYDPATNIELGQRYLEKLSRMPATDGLLTKVIAAYNAGPTPVERWREQVRDGGDPLLFIESVPYYETRAYLNAVMRNYWMYQIKERGDSDALKSLAQGLWSRFPGQGDSIAIRLASDGPAVHAD